MSKKKKTEVVSEPEHHDGCVLDVDHGGPCEFAPDVAPDLMRIRIDVGVNGYKSGDLLTVERTHPFFSGLVKQGLAQELS